MKIISERIPLLDLPENCPICDQKMEKGYVNSGSAGIFWTKKKHKGRLPLDAETLVGSRIFSFSGGIAEAYRCPNCRIVLFSYEKEPSEKQSNSSAAH